MQLNVKAVSNDSKQSQGKTYWGIKHEDGQWYNLVQDQKPSIGQKFEADVKESRFNNRTYRWAMAIAPPQPEPEQPAYSNRATQPWSEWESMAARAHALAKVLEPDVTVLINEESGVSPQYSTTVDRSRARMAFVATVLIAFSNGKIADDHLEEGMPF